MMIELLHIFEKSIYTKGIRITIIIDTVGTTWKLYLKNGYKIIDETYDARQKILTKKLIKIIGYVM